MGIRFACHACFKPLNIKVELAGKRGVCPQCHTRFRIPLADTQYSSPIEMNGVQGSSPLGSVDDDKHPAQQLAAPVHSRGVDAPVAADLTPNASTPLETEIPSPHVSANPTTLTAVSSQEQAARVVTVSLLDDPIAVWYVRPPSGGQYGPASGEMLRTWIAEQRVTANSLVWRDGWAQWRSASEALAEFGGGKAEVAGEGNQGGQSVLDQPVSPTAKAPRSASSNANGVSGHVAANDSHVDLAGDQTIGKQKSVRTQSRFVMIGTLAAVSMTLIGILIYLVRG